MAPCINSFVDKPIRRIGQFLFIVMIVMQEVDSIGCFVCFSFNGSDSSCEDTFNSTVLHKEPNRTDVANYHYPCWALKKKRQGLFPADHCIKVSGYRNYGNQDLCVGFGYFHCRYRYVRTNESVSFVVQEKAEIVRISHCGHFKYNGHEYSGCVQSCDTDGCNRASRMGTHSYAACVVPITAVVFTALHS